MNNQKPITSLYAELKRRPEVRALVPMGYSAGLPLLSVKNDNLVAMVPFLRYKLTGTADRTLVFPIHYVMSFTLPELSVAGFTDLSLHEGFSTVDFTKAIGLFRHDAVKDLDRNAYAQLRAEVLGSLDSLVCSLIGDTPFTASDDTRLRQQLQRIVEPSLKSFYKAIDADFYTKYIQS